MIHLDNAVLSKRNLVYITTEDKRIDTTVPADNFQIEYLFEIINDMGQTYSLELHNPDPITTESSSQYVYGRAPQTNSRYTVCALVTEAFIALQNRINSILGGSFVGSPVGYYKYKVFEATSPVSIPTQSPLTHPLKSDGQIGTLTVRQASFSTGTVIQTTNLIGDTYYKDVKVSDLTGSNGGSAGSYYLNMSALDGTAINNSFSIQGIPQVEAQADGTRWLEVIAVNTIDTGMVITIKSNAPVGYSYDFEDNINANNYYHVTEITSQPQTTNIHLETATSTAFKLTLYDASGGNAGTGSKVWGINGSRLFLVPSTPFNYGLAFATAWNPESIDASGTVLSKGSFFHNFRYGATINSATQNFFVINGQIEEGKLYIEQKDETLKEVKYKQHEEPSGSNYIYYGQ